MSWYLNETNFDVKEVNFDFDRDEPGFHELPTDPGNFSHLKREEIGELEQRFHLTTLQPKLSYFQAVSRNFRKQVFDESMREEYYYNRQREINHVAWKLETLALPDICKENWNKIISLSREADKADEAIERKQKRLAQYEQQAKRVEEERDAVDKEERVSQCKSTVRAAEMSIKKKRQQLQALHKEMRVILQCINGSLKVMYDDLRELVKRLQEEVEKYIEWKDEYFTRKKRRRLRNTFAQIATADDEGECPLCYCPFIQGERLRGCHECDQIWHTDCIYRYLQMHAACPAQCGSIL